MRLFILALTGLFLLAQPASAQQFQADSKIKVTSTIVANNTTAVVISAKSGTVYQVDAYNNSTTPAYIKLYNASSATCGSGTPIARYMIPYSTDSSGTASGGGFVAANINGDAYANGISMCVTTGIADNNTGAPAASTYIVNVHWRENRP